MTDTDSAHGDDALSRKIDLLERECQALSQALARGRTVRLGLTLAVAAFLFLGGLAFYRLGSQVKSQQNVDQLVRLAEDRLAQRSDHMMKEVQLLVDHASPVLTQAFYQQAKTDLPKFLSAMERQRDLLTDNLQRDLRQHFDEHHHASIASFEKILAKEFPATQNPEMHARMMANVELALGNLAQKYYFDKFRDQMNGMYDTLDRFPPAPPPGEGDAPLEDQLVVTLVDLMTLKLTENHTPPLAQVGRVID